MINPFLFGLFTSIVTLLIGCSGNQKYKTQLEGEEGEEGEERALIEDDPEIQRVYKAQLKALEPQRKAEEKARIEDDARNKVAVYDTPLELSPVVAAEHRAIPVALIEPIVTMARCQGEPILVSLPDELACESGNHWVYQPSLRILPPAELLLVSLRFSGLSVSLYPSLAEGERAGAKVAILPMIRQAEAKVLSLQDFYDERHIDAKAFFNGTLAHVVATVKLHAAVVRLDSGEVLWKGPVQQDMERTVPSLPLSQGRALVEAAAGIGKFEEQAYGIRFVVVQAYTQVGRTLATHVDHSLKGMMQ